MTALYIAARFGRQFEAAELGDRLSDWGIEITSTWVHQVEDEMLHEEGHEATGRVARKDLEEVERADGIVYLSEAEDNPWGRGGRHVEFGIAIAFRKELYVIGPLENLFHYLPHVNRFDSAGDFMGYVKENLV